MGFRLESSSRFLSLRIERELLLDADAAITDALLADGGAVAERERGVIGVFRLSFK